MPARVDLWPPAGGDGRVLRRRRRDCRSGGALHHRAARSCGHDVRADVSVNADAGFAERYGPWALIAGAAEGIGAAFGAELAARGVGLLLVDVNAQRLDETAA